jgi:soluble lytic murein transglycosylase
MRSAELDGAGVKDWRAIGDWLAGLGAGDPLPAESALAENPHWTIGRALLDLGMEHRASAELEDVLQASLGDPNMLLILAREFEAIGQTGLSSRAATRLIGQLPDARLADVPEDLWRAAYPAPFAEAVDQSADDSDISNLALLALVRQESFFDPLAGSTAGAIGLTQIVGPTAEEIAEDLDVDGFQMDDLYRPAVSLEFGAHYLRQQLDLLDENIYYALAAYNGGPGNAARWADTADGDVDRFVAEIEFSQTEAYVQLVMEHLARYRQLYQGYDAPVLPER